MYYTIEVAEPVVLHCFPKFLSLLLHRRLSMLRCMSHAGGDVAAANATLQQPLTRRRRHELQQEVAEAKDAASGKRAASRARCPTPAA
jgi:hypothetical protein